jgi:hypothetical protein
MLDGFIDRYIALTRRPLAATAIFFLLTFVVVFGSIAVGKPLNVDENVFIASATLYGRKGLALYRDFHYNHMPTLVLIYAALFHLSDHLILTARTFSSLCGAATAAIVVYFAHRLFSWMSDRRQMLLSVAVGLCLVLDPLFYKTTGMAWNHDFPAMCSTLAFVLLCIALPARRHLITALAGLCVALAFTSRLTFATELLPFACMVLFFPGQSTAARRASLAGFCAGCAVGCLPSLWVISRSWSNAWWGNVTYTFFNTEFLATTRLASHHGMSRLAKLGFFFTRWGAFPGFGLLNIGFVALLIITLKWRNILKEPVHFEIAAAALLALSQVLAGLTPTPPFDQYLYASVPFLVLGVALCLSVPRDQREFRLVRIGLIASLAISLPFAAVYYRTIYVLPTVGNWVPMQLHAQGVRIAKASRHGTILTFSSALALEGGCDIYNELSTGRFAARVADDLTEAQRRQYRLYSTNELLDSIKIRHPAAILLTGTGDGGPEKQLGERALLLGYNAVKIRSVGVLLLAPNLPHRTR